ncbi:hypothetical protein [Actinotalea solisilvae]|uniref:hypothetical protein n=1 Tax=Actinotalea solisilvae TaxID=2072922 RepID=UPI0018F1E9C8|nr:hypothetical protein [Actinotalea solisilvae]
MNQAGIVVIAVAGLWIAYLVPHHLRHRQQLLEARADDRFSERLRVVHVLRPARAGRAPGRRADGSAGRGSHGVAPVPGRTEPLRLHPARHDERARRGVSPMERPHGLSDRVAADLVRRSAAEHAGRAAHLARRSASARRRAALTALLLVAVPVAWVLVPLLTLPVAVGIVPSVLLAAVLVAGRRAVVAAARADAAWEEGEPYRLPAPRRAPSVVGRAVRPSDAVTEVMARVPRVPVAAGMSVALAEAAATVAAASAPAARATAPAPRREAETPAPGPAWLPVPVPRPTYTLKPEARRPEPAPLPAPSDVEAPAARATTDHSTAERPAASASRAERAPATGGLDLDAVLARRRASGE